MHLARAAQGVDVRVARGPRKAQESTWISRDGAAHGASLRTALRVNGALTTLYLINNNINKQGKKQLQDAVQGRQGFTLAV